MAKPFVDLADYERSRAVAEEPGHRVAFVRVARVAARGDDEDMAIVAASYQTGGGLEADDRAGASGLQIPRSAVRAERGGQARSVADADLVGQKRCGDDQINVADFELRGG